MLVLVVVTEFEVSLLVEPNLFLFSSWLLFNVFRLILLIGLFFEKLNSLLDYLPLVILLLGWSIAKFSDL